MGLKGTIPLVTRARCPGGIPCVGYVYPPVVVGLQLLQVCGCAGLALNMTNYKAQLQLLWVCSYVGLGPQSAHFGGAPLSARAAHHVE